MNDPLAKVLASQGPWEWPQSDPPSVMELEKRIAETGRNLGLITYSDLVDGIAFHLPSIQNGAALKIREWTGQNRRIIGHFLAHISIRSYVAAGFLAGTLVVNKQEFKPSGVFFDWMLEVKAIPDLSDNAVLAFWVKHVNNAHIWYKSHNQFHFP